jgi:CRP-like cAMP-binding protein
MPSDIQLDSFRNAVAQFITFTDEQWELFSAHLYTRRIKKRQLFIAAGKTCTEVGFVFSGSFRTFIDRGDMEISNYFSFEGELISSYKSFLRQEASRVNIEAMEDATILCFTHDSIHTLVNDERIALKMERFGRMIAEYLICCYEDRVLTFVTKTPEERYLELLSQQPAILQKIPQYYLANFLGITPVSLSRIRKRIQEEKV